MAASENLCCGAAPRAPVFVTTDWTAVLTAGRTDTPRAQAALAHLCQVYWHPIYYFVRRQGHSTHDAQDFTQEFFTRLLEKNWLARVDQSRGRFRSFLLMAAQRFLAGEWQKANCQKRAGNRHCLPLQWDTAEDRYIHEPADTASPEHMFERQWALTLLEKVLGELRADYERDGRARWFEILKPSILGSRETQPYCALAPQLEMSVDAVKMAVHRLRQRYRERLKAEIARTVASPAEVDDELRHLFRVLARR